MSDAPLKDCPECRGELRKLLYPVGVQFKGSGFYTTDYRSADKSKASSESSETKSETASSSNSSNGSEGGGTSNTPSEKKKKTEPAASKE